MPATTTTAVAKTGAEDAAVTLAAKVSAAPGWEVNISATDSEPRRYGNGKLMISTCRGAYVHADGPRSIGRPRLFVSWYSVIDAVDDDKLGETTFGSAEISFMYDAHEHTLTTEAELNAWLDALIAASTAVEA